MPWVGPACADTFASGGKVCAAIRQISTILVIGFYCAAPPLIAATSQVVIIRNDRGGGVVERMQVIAGYKTAGTQIEIRGQYCLSACTMYLGLRQTCITPATVFGFHGPSSRHHGIALSPSAFEHWSQVMAAHYPEPIRSWFLRKGRHIIVGFHNFSGADLIKMGVARCPA